MQCAQHHVVPRVLQLEGIATSDSSDQAGVPVLALADAMHFSYDPSQAPSQVCRRRGGPSPPSPQPGHEQKPLHECAGPFATATAGPACPSAVA